MADEEMKNTVRVQNVLIIGSEAEGVIEDLKDSLDGIEMEEWNGPADVTWEEELKIRASQSEDSRTKKVVIIRNLKSFNESAKLAEFMSEGSRFGCWAWVVATSFEGVSQETLDCVLGNARAVVGEVGENDIKILEKHGVVVRKPAEAEVYKYGDEVDFGINSEMKYPDFSITYLGEEKMGKPEFRVLGIGIEQVVRYTNETGLMNCGLFKVGEKRYFVVIKKGLIVDEYTKENWDKIWQPQS